MLARAAAAAVCAAMLLAGAVPPRPARAESDPYERILEEYRRKLKTDDPDRAVSGVKLLDPENPRSMPEYLDLLARWHWRVRGAAIEALASVKAPALRAEMRLHLVTHAEAWVREGMAFAMTLGPVPGDGEALAAAMDDADWRVRRTSARGLGEIVSRDGVERLVRALAVEKDLRVIAWVRSSLRGIVREDFGRDPAPWREWFEKNRDRPEWRKQGEEIVRGQFAGIPLERVTTDRPSRSEEERKAREARPELLVLSPFGWSHGWFRPYLDEASEFVRITYVTLPTVQEVTGSSGYGQSIPVYPVTKLAKALDEVRKAGKRDKVLLLAPGAVGWAAERYALDFPDRIAGLVIVDGWLDAQSYAAALTRLSREGSVSERRAAGTLLASGRRDREEAHDLRSAFLTSSLTDTRDSEAFRLWRDAARDHGFAVVPPLVFDRQTRIETPTLFTFPDPALQPFSGGAPEEFRRIRESFRNPPPVLAVMRDTRGLAHVEDPAEFLRVLRGFFDFAGILK
ncbi:MAG: hypothetical protein HMLKMBBP_00769 [Planctomycetes bacterium]|nr:hypothetical protein [Planctomycetota bacterium]